MASGVDERAALVRNRPPVRRGIRDLVGGEWGRFRAERHGSDAGGSFIRRVARTPHYDGVKKDGQEPAVIAICGMGPITFHAVNASQPNLRVL